VVVLAHVEVDLGEAGDPDLGVDVEQQRRLDRVAGGERQPHQQVAARGHLARQRLADVGQLGPEAAQQRARRQLGHAAAVLREPVAERAAEERLDVLGTGDEQQRSGGARDEVLAEVPGIPVDVADDVAVADRQRAPHRVPLAARGAERRHQRVLADDLDPGAARDVGGAVGGVGVDDDRLVDQVALAQRRERLGDRSDRPRAVACRHDDGQRRPPAGKPLRGEFGVVEGRESPGHRT
jgi:hypothetical protein